MLEPPFDRKGNVTPVNGMISTVPKALSMVCNRKIDAAVHALIVNKLLLPTEPERMQKIAREMTTIIAIITISNPHSSQSVAMAISESAAKMRFNQPFPAPKPRKPPEAIHISARVC